MVRRKLLFMSVFSLLLVDLWFFITLLLKKCVCIGLFWWEDYEMIVFIIWTLIVLVFLVKKLDCF